MRGDYMFPADRIKLLRKQKDMTQTELSSRLGIDRTTLTKYESGERKPDITQLYKIADFFGVSIEYITGRSDSIDISSISLDELLNPLNNNSVTFGEILLSAKDKENILNYIRLIING